MASLSIDSIINSAGVGNVEPDAYMSSKDISFAKRAVRVFLLGVGTIAFPIMMGAALISELCFSYGDTNTPRTVNIKRAVSAMMFAVPVLGPIVVWKWSDELVLHNHMLISESSLDDTEHCYFIMCIPLLSAFIIAREVVDYNLGIPREEDLD
ncbi:MAG: hypothetical protein KAG53_05145 [Endozoicomonadaceae bacterium]|nr:hypothetical protein [Endozoicomonadaceae bacterium]